MRASSTAARRTRAVESFATAADAIGPVVAGLSMFAVTRGQFSMVDAVHHCVAACAPAKVALWTWTIADYEIQAFTSLLGGDIVSGRLVIDPGGQKKNADMLRAWQAKFGPKSVQMTLTHAKMALVEGNGLRVLLRGSMNLNYNPRFEQLDVTEGGPDFDLVERIMGELPYVPIDAHHAAIRKSARVTEAFEPEQLAIFSGVKRWAK